MASRRLTSPESLPNLAGLALEGPRIAGIRGRGWDGARVADVPAASPGKGVGFVIAASLD